MTYVYQVLRDNPIGIWPMDSNLLDASGYNLDASILSGSVTSDRPVVARGVSSYYLNTVEIGYPDNSIMTSAHPAHPFTLEAWVKIHNRLDTTYIMLRTNSGLFIDSGILYFRVKLGTTTIDISYPWLNVGDVYHVVGVFTQTDIYLYVNGEVVGSASIDDSVLAQGFADTNTVLLSAAYTGASATIDTPAIYNYNLTERQIASHYSVGTSYPSVYDISRTNGGNVYIFNSSHASVKLESDDFDGTYTDVALIDDELVNLIDPDIGTYSAGVWEKSISLTDDTVNVNGSSISWVASSGIVFSVAIDEGAYVVVTNGSQPVSTLVMTTDHTIRVKAEFPAGASQSFIKNFNFTAYYSKAISGSDSSIAMTITNPDNVSLETTEHHPVEFADTAGALIGSTGALSIASDANFGGYEAVEFTVYQTSNIVSGTVFSMGGTTPPSIATNSSGQWIPTNLTALIVDGVVISAATAIALNRWHHVVAIFAANTNVINVSSGLRIGYLAAYPANISEVTTAGAQAMYKNWVGAPAIQLIDSDVHIIREHIFPETGVAAKAYSYDWQITPA